MLDMMSQSFQATGKKRVKIIIIIIKELSRLTFGCQENKLHQTSNNFNRIKYSLRLKLIAPF